MNFYEASRRQRCLYCDCNLRAAEREIGPKNTIAPAAYDGVYRVPLRTALGGWASRTTACLITPLSPISQTNPKPSMESLPQETLNFAHRMFDAARDNNAELLLQAVDAGLPPNLTNDKGAS